MKIIWTEKAERQVNQIFDYIAFGSTLHAYRTVNKFIDCTELIAENPRIGRKVPEFDKENLREMFVFSYRIIYQLEKNEIHIVGVIHGARLARRTVSAWDKDFSQWILWTSGRKETMIF